uniref:Putative disease resistance gene NBS-LRR family protein n=1 Tax=Rhizophora mucronata TaxID=61149 RepID=A0A2P2LKX4_RHIMU
MLLLMVAYVIDPLLLL